MALTDKRVAKFEEQLDRTLMDRATARSGGTEAIRLAAKMVEFADAERREIGDHLAKGLQVLAPTLITRQPGDVPQVETLVRDLDFAAHYYTLREFLYFTHNAPGSIGWTFGDQKIDIRFNDPSIPRQFFLVANNWFLESMRIFANDTGTDRVKETLAGLS